MQGVGKVVVGNQKEYGNEESVMKCIWISQETGEVYRSRFHMVKTIIGDMVHYKKCRTWKMFNVKKEVF